MKMKEFLFRVYENLGRLEEGIVVALFHCVAYVSVPTLKTLCMLAVLDAGLDPSCLPQDVR